jgi:hypothetical protein
LVIVDHRIYRRYGKEPACRIELYDCAHLELPTMRQVILDWMDKYLGP